MFENAEIIHTYTRTDAINDGVIVETFTNGNDMSKAAAEAGFAWPVAMTRAAFTETVEWTEDGWQDEDGRMWDVLTMAMVALKREIAKSDTMITPGYRIPFTLMCVPPGKSRPVTTHLHMVLTPKEDRTPAWLFTLPNED